MFEEFKNFIARGNVMDMAVGIIMGAAFTAIVTSLVGDVVMPVIGVITSGIDFSQQYVALNGETYASMQAAKDAGAAIVSYGLFINAVIKFLIVAFVVFMLVKGVNKIKDEALKKEEEKPAEAAATPADIALLQEIRDLLKK